jgi:hypothetical protein
MQNYIYSTVPLKKIKTVQFGIFSPEEIVTKKDQNWKNLIILNLFTFIEIFFSCKN